MSEPTPTEASSSASESAELDTAMSIWEHLDEFRRRLVRVVVALCFTTGLCWFQKERILNVLATPYVSQWHASGMPGQPELQSFEMGGNFTAYMRLAITCGLILGVPIIFWELWSFISPGLYAKEKRFILPFVLCSSFLFLSGVVFAQKLAFPMAVQYFFSLSGTIGGAGLIVAQRTSFESFLDFTTAVHLIFGVVFELPILIVFLVIAGLVTRAQLWKFSRYAIFASIAIGAIATPGGDVVFQMIVAGALSGLYFSSILLSYLVSAGAKKEEPAA